MPKNREAAERTQRNRRELPVRIDRKRRQNRAQNADIVAFGENPDPAKNQHQNAGFDRHFGRCIRDGYRARLMGH
jgi:hypothetical protein